MISERGRRALHRQMLRMSRRLSERVLAMALVALAGWSLLGAGSAVAETPDKETARQFRAQIERAMSCFRDGDTACALDGYDKAYQLNPQPLLLFNLAQIYRKSGQVERALAHYQRFLQEAPQSELAPEVREYVSALGESMQAASAAPASSSPAPARSGDNFIGTDEKRQELFRMHIERSGVFFKAADYEHAIAEYWLAYELKPQSIIVFNVAQAYRKAERWVEAKTLYERYLREEPSSPLAGEVEGYLTEAKERLRAQQLNSENSATRRLVQASSALAERMAELREIERQLGEKRLAAARRESRPVYRRAWFWGVLGAGVVGVALGVGLGVGLQPKLPDTDLGKVVLSF